MAGNTKTKEKIINRELLFAIGDTINKTDFTRLITKTKENLFNTSLFNFITIKFLNQDGVHTTIFVIVEERWYLWPYPILEHADRNLSAFLHEKDWSRINYGVMVTKFNFRGRKETVKIKARFGYKEQFQIYYNNPYLTKNKKHGFSTELSWYRQQQVGYEVRNDELNYYQDSTNYIQKYQTFNLSYSYRNLYYNSHHFSIGMLNGRITDTIAKINPNYFGNGQSKLDYFSIGYEFNHDKRDYKYYPLKGHNIKVYINQKGLGILKNTLTSTWNFGLEMYKYFDFDNRWYSGIGGVLKLSSPNDHPFFLNYGLGYNDYLRAYEYNVIKGQNYFTTRSFIKFALIPRKVIYIKAWGWEKFNKIHYSIMVNAFFDSGYINSRYQHESNKLPNQYLYSGGVGIDLATYYDIIFRLEYSVNKNKESGVFLHLGKAF